MTGPYPWRSERLLDCVGIVVVAAAATLLLRPFQDAPFVDDWVYAWSVEHLLDTGRLEVLDFADNFHGVQTLWGLLLCLPFGFSFTALRVSTWLAALAGLCGLYLLLRELDVPRRDALLGTAALGLYPTFAMLGVTFMTDIPFLSLTILASLAMVRALREHRLGWLIVAAVCAALAGGVRVVGVVTPIAMLLSLVLGRDNWGRQRARWAVALVPMVLFVAMGFWWRSRTHHVADLTWLETSTSDRLANLVFALPLLPRMAVETFGMLAGTLGLALLPLAVACLPGRTVRWTLAMFGVMVAVLVACRAAGFGYILPLATGQMWAFNELGGTTTLVPGFGLPRVPALVSWAGLALGTVSLAVSSTAVVTRRGWKPGEAFLLWSMAGHCGLIALLWLIHDRYVLVLVPLAIAVVLSAGPRLNWRVATGALVALALVTGTGIADHLRYNGALWQAVDALRRTGVAERDINGGYMVNGWLQYAHADRAFHDGQGNVDVAWVNGADEPPYRIANAPQVGWTVLDTFDYERRIGPSGRIYVLQAETPAARSR
jgi:hypothetical protein